MRGVVSEALVSRKVACCETYTEGSETTKSGSDEQKRHMRLLGEDKQAHHCNVPNLSHLIVDVAGIGRRKKLLPGEVLEVTGLLFQEVSVRLSSRRSLTPKSEAIVVGRNEPMNEAEVSQADEGLNVKQLQISNGVFISHR